MDQTYYTRLRTLKECAIAFNNTSDSARRNIEESVTRLSEVHRDLNKQVKIVDRSIRGATQTPLSQKIAELSTDVALKAIQLRQAKIVHDSIGLALGVAQREYDRISTELIDVVTLRQARNSPGGVLINENYYTVGAYIAAVRYQQNRLRENASQKAIAVVEESLTRSRSHLETIKSYRINSSAPATDPSEGYKQIRSDHETIESIYDSYDTPGHNGGHQRSGFGLTGVATATGFAQYKALRIPSERHRDSYRRPPSDGWGSRYQPITDPRALRHLDLLNTPINAKMTADGPVGGYIPPRVNDLDDPRWSTIGRSQHGGTHGMQAGFLGAGTAALGGLGAQRAWSSASRTHSSYGAAGRFGSNPGTSWTTPTGQGHTGMTTPGMPRPAMPGSSGIPGAAGTPGASGMPGTAGTPGTAGMPGGVRIPSGAGMPAGAGTPSPATPSPLTGTTNSTTSPSMTSPTSGASGSGTANGPLMGGAHGGAAGANASRENAKRIGYDVVHVDDDEAEVFAPTDAYHAGNSSQVQARKIHDTSDSWE